MHNADAMYNNATKMHMYTILCMLTNVTSSFVSLSRSQLFQRNMLVPVHATSKQRTTLLPFSIIIRLLGFLRKQSFIRIFVLLPQTTHAVFHIPTQISGLSSGLELAATDYKNNQSAQCSTDTYQYFF